MYENSPFMDLMCCYMIEIELSKYDSKWEYCETKAELWGFPIRKNPRIFDFLGFNPNFIDEQYNTDCQLGHNIVLQN